MQIKDGRNSKCHVSNVERLEVYFKFIVPVEYIEIKFTIEKKNNLPDYLFELEE